VDQVFQEITQGGVIRDPTPGDWFVIPPNGALSEAKGWMNAYDALGASRSVRILAYEGGQHLVGVGSSQWDTLIRDLFINANRDPRMGAAYTNYLSYWKSGTVNDRLELFSAFNLAGRYSEFGSWGALEYIEQAGSPKYDALSGFATAQPCWWSNCNIGMVSTASLTVSKSGNGVGQVTSNPQGVNCGLDCSEDYPAGTTVTLTATPDSSSTFTGWSGACSGTGTCQVSMSANRTVTASFALPARPDLVVTSITLSPTKPARYRSFSAKVTVKNQGAAAGVIGSLGLWLNQSGAMGCGANADKAVTLGNLAAGASTTYTFTGLSAGAAGSKTLRVFADRLCGTTEAQEGNNQATKTYDVR
jgi:hypothetical protein